MRAARAARGAAGLTPPLRSCLYAGRVVHERLRPVRHRFAYRVLSLLLDLDELDEVDRRLRLFSVGRPNLLGFRPADHGPCDGGPLKPWALAELARAGIVLAEPRIELLCFPRVLGYAFNPLSLWFCHDGERLAAVIHEVRNTFGGRHRYVMPVDGLGPVARHTVPKAFHVSPFVAMDAAYDSRCGRRASDWRSRSGSGTRAGRCSSPATAADACR